VTGFIKVIALIGIAALLCWADDVDTLVVDTNAAAVIDTMTIDASAVDVSADASFDALLAEAADAGGIESEPEKLALNADADTASAHAPHAKLHLVRRDHDYARQTRLAVVMMVFIAVILSTTQSWNPRQ